MDTVLNQLKEARRKLLEERYKKLNQKVTKTIVMQSTRDKHFKKFFAGDNTIIKLANPGNPLAGWISSPKTIGV